MHRFIANENIRRFKEQLGNCSDALESKTLKQLLATEEGKLRDIMRTRS